jgi:hypothetical protein
VRVIYDHRVLDGATVARALEDLEGILNYVLPDLLCGGGRRLADGGLRLAACKAERPAGRALASNPQAADPLTSGPPSSS